MMTLPIYIPADEAGPIADDLPLWPTVGGERRVRLASWSEVNTFLMLGDSYLDMTRECPTCRGKRRAWGPVLHDAECWYSRLAEAYGDMVLMEMELAHDMAALAAELEEEK